MHVPLTDVFGWWPFREGSAADRPPVAGSRLLLEESARVPTCSSAKGLFLNIGIRTENPKQHSHAIPRQRPLGTQQNGSTRAKGRFFVILTFFSPGFLLTPNQGLKKMSFRHEHEKGLFSSGRNWSINPPPSISATPPSLREQP